MTYDPSLIDFCDFLKDYALSGLKYFHGLDGRDQTRIRRRIAPIEDGEQQIEQKFNKAKYRNQTKFNFIPMPKPTSDFTASFFVPTFLFSDGDEFRCAFSLIAWIDHGDGRTISFRLELADKDDSTHSYNH